MNKEMKLLFVGSIRRLVLEVAQGRTSARFVPALVMAALLPAMTWAMTQEEIDRAVRDLGAADFKNRNAAKQLLATAGKDAIPALEKVEKSNDPEVRRIAQDLLTTARLGLTAAFPEEFRQMVAEFARAGRERKKELVQRLAGGGPPAQKVLLDLAASVKDEESRAFVFQPVLEPAIEVIQATLQIESLGTNQLSSLLADTEFYLTIMPEDPLDVDREIAVGLDTLAYLDKHGHTAEANAFFDRQYRRMEKLCDATPQDANKHNRIAWFCVVARRRFDDGFKHVEQALKLDPQNLGFLNTKAELLFQTDRNKEALELMEQCIQLNRDPGTEYYNMQRKRFEKGDKSAPRPFFYD